MPGAKPKAKIYKPAKTAMQSGRARTRDWVLRYERQTPRKIEPLMGYTASDDPLSQVQLTFETKEDAIRYAEREGLDYRVFEQGDPRRMNPKSYSDNFKWDRKVPWTH